VLCVIRLSEAKPESAVWVPIWIDGHPFFAALDQLYNIAPDAPDKALGGRTPRDFLASVHAAMPASR